MNSYIIYFEEKNPDFPKTFNGKTLMCDDFAQLLYQTREMETKGKDVQNVVILTVQNSKPQ